MGFDQKFAWGAATASFQIEGNSKAAGKGMSIWDQFSQQDGKTEDGYTGEPACDHINRIPEDVQLMKQIGLKAYRFSFSWPRIIPGGTGKISAEGLAVYDRLVDQLLEHGIDPWATIYHWDLPLDLHHRGGWLNPDIQHLFAEYTRVLAEQFSDRVQHWITLNEPQVISHLGYNTGEHAPGHHHSLSEILTVVHHGLLAHGRAVQVLRQCGRTPAKIGTGLVGIHHIPYDNSAESAEHARQLSFSVARKDSWNSAWYSDPIFLGRYPEDGLKRFQSEMPAIHPDDFDVIQQELDFCGLNIYHGNPTVNDNQESAGPSQPPGFARTAMGWPVTPEALYWGPRFFYDRYGLPIVITENGMANCDWVHLDGKVHDPQRIDFHIRYLRELRRAAGDGIKIHGYFIWSLLDNFEWAFGYNRRFGLIHVDYESQVRTMKDSAFWYRDTITANGENLT